MITRINIKNEVCGCCNNLIHKELGTVRGVFGVSIHFEENYIEITHTDEVSYNDLIAKLREMGYNVD